MDVHFIEHCFIVQIMNWSIIPTLFPGRVNSSSDILSLIVLVQYIPRAFLIFPLNRRIIKNTGVVTKTAWAGAAYNLLLYMLASHVHSLFLFLSLITIILIFFRNSFCFDVGNCLILKVKQLETP